MQMLTMSNIASFEQCVIELVANSLNAHAAAIAIRIHTGKREIHVIDNGVGITKDMLKRVAKYDTEAIDDQQQVCKLLEPNYLADIRRSSDRLTITSRHRYSEETFMKAFEMGFALNLRQTEQRPAYGTTVSIYGFYEIPPHEKWSTSTICFLITAIAVTKLEVSFSIRDEERKKVVLRIAKPHSPFQALRTLVGKDLSLNHVWTIQCGPERSANYHGYVGLSDKNHAIQWIFLNHRPICCPLILKSIQIVFKEKLNLSSDQKSNARDSYDENVFILFFLTLSQKEFTRVTENGKRHIVFYDMRKILNTIKNCAFQCLAEKTTVSAPYSCKTQLLKQIYFKTEKSIFTNDINKRKNVTSSMMKSRMITLERRKIISTIMSTNCLSKQRNRDDNIETASCYINKKNNDVLNSIRYRADVTSVKGTNLYLKDKAMKKIHNDIYKTQGNSMNFDVTDNSIESDKVYCDSNNNNDTINMISPLSEWSNWTYYTNNKKRDLTRNMFPENGIRSRQFFERNNQFDFLPRKLYGLLQHRHVKLTNVKCLNSPNDTIPFAENWQLDEQIAVHPCKLKQKLCEFRVSQTSLKYIKIINQVNDEFIAAWMTWNEMEILLMIDQHAIHERIRYENLLLRYKVQNEDELFSVHLRDPLSMEFPTEMCNLFLRNQILLRKYGISLGSSKKNTLVIRTVPQCLITNSDPCNSEKILPKIYSLLNDVINNCTSQTNALPSTIHNAIASEACHGAIKFGDKLTLEQCTSLIQLLKHTKFPNRCAHGRPTIIPVIEFSELKNRSARILEVSTKFLFPPILS